MEQQIKVNISKIDGLEIIEKLTNKINQLKSELELAKHTEQHLHSAEAQLVKQEKEIALLRSQLKTALADSDAWKEFSKVKVEQAKDLAKQLQAVKAKFKKVIDGYNYWKVSSEINYRHMCELIDDNSHLKDSYDELLAKYLGTLK